MTNQLFVCLLVFMLGVLLFMGGSLAGSKPTMVVGFGVSLISFIVMIVLFLIGT